MRKKFQRLNLLLQELTTDYRELGKAGKLVEIACSIAKTFILDRYELFVNFNCARNSLIWFRVDQT